MEQFLKVAGIPLLTAVACIYYGIKLMVFKDTDCIRGNMGKKLKDKDSYARNAGKLMFFFAFCSLVMAVLVFINTLAAAIEISVSLVVLALLWSKTEKEFGAEE